MHDIRRAYPQSRCLYCGDTGEVEIHLPIIVGPFKNPETGRGRRFKIKCPGPVHQKQDEIESSVQAMRELRHFSDQL
ncbi:MAG: hypothetical protein KKE05_02875 [Nanoarchaeota archaeon]|nr:hypothetical protein [Nanoarchaeota archaeon]